MSRLPVAEGFLPQPRNALQSRYLFSRYIVRWRRGRFGSKPPFSLKRGAGAKPAKCRSRFALCPILLGLDLWARIGQVLTRTARSLVHSGIGQSPLQADPFLQKCVLILF